LKQQALEEERESKRRQEEEAKLAKEWSVGAKDNSKVKALEDKDLEKQRKQAEKAALLAAEEEQLSGIKKVFIILCDDQLVQFDDRKYTKGWQN